MQKLEASTRSGQKAPKKKMIGDAIVTNIKNLPIVSSNSKVASRIIIRARKSAKGETKLFNPLFLYKDSKKSGLKKQYTSEIQEILRFGHGLNF